MSANLPTGSANVRASAFRRPRGRSPLIWIGLLVTVGFGYIAVRDVKLSDTWDAFERSTYWPLIPALGVFALAIVLRALRWQALFAPETRPPLRAVTRALLVGYFFNNLLPLRAGEAARVIALRQSAGTSRGETAATIVVERVYDVSSLVGLLFLTIFWLPDISWIGGAAVFAAVLAAGIVAAVVVLTRWRDEAVELGFRLVERLPFMPSDPMRRAVHGAARGSSALTSVPVACRAAVWTILSWLVMAASFWLVMLCFDLELSPVAGLLDVIATSLSLILPSSPAAIGVFEAAVVIALDAYGVPRAEALSYALVLHALNFFPFILAGGAILGPQLRRGGGS